jgi:hypothetical protein
VGVWCAVQLVVGTVVSSSAVCRKYCLNHVSCGLFSGQITADWSGRSSKCGS